MIFGLTRDRTSYPSPSRSRASGRKVLRHDIPLFHEFEEGIVPRLGLEVQRDATLVGVEIDEVRGVGAVGPRNAPTSRVTPLKLLNLDDVRAEPGEHLRAQGAGLEPG